MKLLIFIMAITAVASSISAEPDLAASLDSLLADAALANAHVGFALYDYTADSSINCRDCDKLFNPASNMKLFTSAAALELLGPTYRFKTRFLTTGNVDRKGKLDGDLVIVGGGDPLISGRFRDTVTAVLESWADSLAFYGIREIKGNIVVDGSFFTGGEFGGGWSLDDLTYWYACPVSALAFNDNCVDLEFFPSKQAGDPAIIILNPPADYIKVTNKAVTVPADSEFTLDYFRIPFTNDVTFFGGIPLDDTAGQVDYVSVHRPDIYCGRIFADVLNDRNIEFKGNIEARNDFKNKPVSIFTWQSDSLGVVVSVINKNSQNFFAEQTLKTIGREIGDVGSFGKGLELIAAFLDSIGIGADDISISDGSGLSHYNIVKPSAIIKLLGYMWRSPFFETYYASLAIPGADRSVRDRLEGIEFREYARTKTGSIANTRTFSGYIRGPRTGRLLGFSIMVNHYTCKPSYVHDWFDSIVARILAEY